MQQLEQCRRILRLSSCPQVRLKGYGYVGSVELTLFACLLSLLLSAYLRTITPNYIILGLLLPLYLAHRGVPIGNYWLGLALLLLLRRFTSFLAFLDIVLLICLWNPNIGLGRWLAERVLPTCK